MGNFKRIGMFTGLIMVAGALAACGGGGESDAVATAPTAASTGVGSRGAGLLDSATLSTASPAAAANDSGSTGATASSSPVTPVSTPSVPVANRAPSLTGTAATAAIAGQAYSFQPHSSDADGDALTFSIANKPSWASFNAATGRLSGTPAAGDVGTYQNVRISANDGHTATALAAFTVTVAALGQHSATLSWNPPSENVDGSALTDLHGYKIYYGTTPGNYTQTVSLTNASLSRYVVENLGTGTYYFSISAINAAGVESSLSGEVSTSL